MVKPRVTRMLLRAKEIYSLPFLRKVENSSNTGREFKGMA